MLMYMASYLGLNIFVETVGSYPDFIDKMINDFCNYNRYIPIILYPYIDNFQIQKNKIYERALAEGRFPSIKHVEEEIPNVDKVFIDLFFDVNTILEKRKIPSMYIMKYANVNLDQNEIANYDFKKIDTTYSKFVSKNEADANNLIVKKIVI